MRLKVLSAAIAATACVLAANDLAAKSPHSFRSSVDVQARSNTNISLAPSSNSSFNFASLKEFDESNDDGVEGEEEEEDEEEEDDFEDIADIEGSDYDELELAESDNPDEDGDGVDDLIDDDQDTGDGDDEADDGEDDGEGGSMGKAVGSRSSSVERLNSKLGFAHKFKISKAASYATSVKFSLDRQPGRSDLNKLNTALATGPEFKLSKRVTLKTGLSYVRLQQASDKFLTTAVGTLGMDFDASKTFSLGFDYNYQDKDVTDPDSPDAIVNTLTFGADWKLSGNDIVKVKYSPQVEDNSVVTRDKDVSGFEVAYSRKLPWDTVLGIGFKRDDVEYKKLPTPRSDRINSAAVQLETEFTKRASASVAYETRQLDSNINSKDGKNRSVLVSFGYKF